MFLVKLAVFRKKATAKTRIWDLYWMPSLVAEGLFIFIHPNWLASGYKIWIFDYNIGYYYYYHLNDIFTLILTLKCVYLITIIVCQSTYGSTRGYRVCGMFGCRADTRFILKCLLRDSPLFYIFATLVLGIFIFGWISMICEAPVDRLNLDYQESTFNNSCWKTICTMSSVGYGDIYPKTLAGRLNAFAEIIFGVVIISLLVVTLNNSMVMSSAECNSYTVMKRLEIREMIKETAVKILVTINRRQPDKSLTARQKRLTDIQQLLSDFKSLQRVYKSIGETSLADEVAKSTNSINGYLTDIKEMLGDWMDDSPHDSKSEGGSGDGDGDDNNGDEVNFPKWNTKTRPSHKLSVLS